MIKNIFLSWIFLFVQFSHSFENIQWIKTTATLSILMIWITFGCYGYRYWYWSTSVVCLIGIPCKFSSIDRLMTMTTTKYCDFLVWLQSFHHRHHPRIDWSKLKKWWLKKQPFISVNNHWLNAHAQIESMIEWMNLFPINHAK